MGGIAIPLTSTTNEYADPNAAVFDFGQTPYSVGFLIVQNAAAFVSLRTGYGQGSNDWQAEIPYGPTLINLAQGGASLMRRTTGPDLIYGVRARSLVAGAPAVVYGGAWAAGDASATATNQLSGTITPGGTVVPGVGLINGVTGRVSSAGAILNGTGFTVSHPTPGNGNYAITYTTPLAAVGVVLVTVEGGAFFGGIGSATNLTTGFVAVVRDQTGAAADVTFDFVAVTPQ